MADPAASLAPDAHLEREGFRAQTVAAIPGWYSPWLHLGFPSLFGLSVTVGALVQLRAVRAWELLAVPVVWLLNNASEWRIHRDVLHRRTPGLAVLYDRHTPEHHRVFVREDMSIRSVREFRLVLIPSYGIVVTAIVHGALTAGIAWAGQPNLAVLFLATSMFYVLSYEWLHLSYHLPPASWIGRRRAIRFLRQHHAWHHTPALMQRWNFNVTVPLWDWIRGTIYRSDLKPGP